MPSSWDIWLAALPSTNYCGSSFTNIMPWAAQWEDFQPFIAMRSVILQPISYQRCVMTYVWSHPLNPYPATFSVIFHCLKKWRCSLEYHGMRGFWSLQQQSAFFKVHVWVFNPNAPTYRDPLSIFMLGMSSTREAKCLWTACSWHWTRAHTFSTPLEGWEAMWTNLVIPYSLCLPSATSTITVMYILYMKNTTTSCMHYGRQTKIWMSDKDCLGL